MLCCVCVRLNFFFVVSSILFLNPFVVLMLTPEPPKILPDRVTMLSVVMQGKLQANGQSFARVNGAVN